MILVTGSKGLIGAALIPLLRNSGCEVSEFDIRNSPREDVRNFESVRKAVSRVDGIVHLSAVSRVVWAQQHPELAYSVNIGGLKNILAASSQQQKKPWIIFASSREVYGNAKLLPVDENRKLCPINIYAKTKVEGEKLISEAATAGLNANICRFSNVYGSIDDHMDRVVVAFAKRAAFGGVISVEGGNNMFDFTHVNDVSEGLFRLAEATSRGERLSPVHFVSGNGTTLNDLAMLAVSHAAGYSRVTISEVPPRNFDVSRFRGDPTHAKDLLGWEAQTPFPVGFENLVTQFRKADAPLSVPPPWLHLLMNNKGL